MDRGWEAVLLGMLLPVLLWFHSVFLRKSWVKALIAGLLVLKLCMSFFLTQAGWCGRIIGPDYRDADTLIVEKSWDVRADWRSKEPRCSAVIDRPYLDGPGFPVWFSNLSRGTRKEPLSTYTMEVEGFIAPRQAGELSFKIGPDMLLEGRVGSHSVGQGKGGAPGVWIEPGVHPVLLEIVLTGSSWRFEPLWNGGDMWREVDTTVKQPNRLDRMLSKPLGFIVLVWVWVILALWLRSAFRVYRPAPAFLTWVLGASFVMALIGWMETHSVGSVHLPRLAILLLLGCLGIPAALPLRNLRGAFLLVGVPWLSFSVARSLDLIGKVSFYPSGDDWFAFQWFAHQIFMEGRWLEGGEPVFQVQPLYRWVVGLLHLVFGDSSVGELYWDSIGLLIMSLFAFHVVKKFSGFKPGLFALVVTLATFVIGPVWAVIGRGLADISGAAFAYLACFWLLRSRLRDPRGVVLAGFFAVLAFYTRLNHLPFVIAIGVLVWPLSVPAERWIHPRHMLRYTSVGPFILYELLIAAGVALFALRTWHYTGVFSVMHGTIAGYHWMELAPAAILPGEILHKILINVLRVVSVHGMPGRSLLEDPRGVLVMLGAFSALLAVLRVPGPRRLPLGPCVVCLGAIVFSLYLVGRAYPGRFSIHLIPAATALAVCTLSLVFNDLKTWIGMAGSLLEKKDRSAKLLQMRR
ncbi:MAG: hypothetical protein HYY14_02460 [Candidatus Omnitrophica bacterium]|nr:hypothetical protein [Candidatus Omnitrophota bacterium]